MAAIQRFLPAVLHLIEGIRAEGGIFNYLKSLLWSSFGSIFGRLRQGEGFVPKLIETFAKLAGIAKQILTALSHNDCKPLFDALSQLRRHPFGNGGSRVGQGQGLLRADR